LGLIHYSLVCLQLPGLIGAIILTCRPSIAKALLYQQYFGVTGLVVSIIKSLLLVAYTVYYIVEVYLTAQQHPQTGGGLGFSYAPDLKLNLFPNLFPTGNSENSGLIVIIITILYAVIVAFELGSLFLIGWIFLQTHKMIKIIKLINYQSLVENPGQNVEESPRPSVGQIVDSTRQSIESQNHIELAIALPQAPALLLRQDSGFNNLITGSIGELPDEEDEGERDGRQIMQVTEEVGDADGRENRNENQRVQESEGV